MSAECPNLAAKWAEVQAQEEAYNKKTEELQRKCETGGIVSRRQAKLSLAAHLAEEPPFRKAKLTLEAQGRARGATPPPRRANNANANAEKEAAEKKAAEEKAKKEAEKKAAEEKAAAEKKAAEKAAAEKKAAEEKAAAEKKAAEEKAAAEKKAAEEKAAAEKKAAEEKAAAEKKAAEKKAADEKKAAEEKAAAEKAAAEKKAAEKKAAEKVAEKKAEKKEEKKEEKEGGDFFSTASKEQQDKFGALLARLDKSTSTLESSSSSSLSPCLPLVVRLEELTTSLEKKVGV